MYPPWTVPVTARNNQTSSDLCRLNIVFIAYLAIKALDRSAHQIDHAQAFAVLGTLLAERRGRAYLVNVFSPTISFFLPTKNIPWDHLWVYSNSGFCIMREYIDIFLCCTDSPSQWLVKISMAGHCAVSWKWVLIFIGLSCFGVLGPLNIFPSTHDPWGSTDSLNISCHLDALVCLKAVTIWSLLKQHHSTHIPRGGDAAPYHLWSNNERERKSHA